MSSGQVNGVPVGMAALEELELWVAVDPAPAPPGVERTAEAGVEVDTNADPDADAEVVAETGAEMVTVVVLSTIGIAVVVEMSVM